jgi:VWFA-related protein
VVANSLKHWVAALVLTSTAAYAQEAPAGAGQAPQATFRSAVEVVTVSASVRTSGGKVVRDLKQSDFEVIDTGTGVAIRDFYAGEGPISLALLLDISGSMDVGGNMDRARSAVSLVLNNLRTGSDEAAMFTFDSSLRQVVDFSTNLSTVNRVNLAGKPWGITSLYDAIAASARLVAQRSNRHRALLVITDGVDTGSKLTAPQVSGIASSIDVPVYVMAVVNPLDHPAGEFEARPSNTRLTGQGALVDLARWTGGEAYFASVPSHASIAVQGLVAELRHQYLITFEPGERPGWHPLEVRTKKKNLVVHARGGYMAGTRTGS